MLISYNLGHDANLMDTACMEPTQIDFHLQRESEEHENVPTRDSHGMDLSGEFDKKIPSTAGEYTSG